MEAETISYRIAGREHAGVLVYDKAITTRRPALLMAPNWMGVTAAAIERARLIAGDRYVVFVADMYGTEKRPKDFNEAAAMSEPLKTDAVEGRRRIRAAFDAMLAEGEKRGLTDQRRGAVGFCFGGGNVFELARDGADLAAAVCIHGDLHTAAPASAGAIKAKLLVLHGSADPVVPKTHRDEFEAEMDAAGAKWEMLLFSGVLHAYTDIGMDVPRIARYDEHATRHSYALMHAFLADAWAGKL
jgi:dienelactone hydrolase